MLNQEKLILIVGGGKTGSYLAGLLLKAGRKVRMLENRPPVFERLVEEMPEGVPVLGDGTSPSLLEQVGIPNANVLAAVTGDDETNLVAASLAKFEYQVERVIVRVNNPRNAWLCTPEMGVDAALNQSDLIAKMILEEMVIGDLQTLVRLRRGAVEIVEERIQIDSSAAEKSIAELALPAGCNIMAVVRGSDVILPNGSTILQTNDDVLAVVHADKRDLLRKALE